MSRRNLAENNSQPGKQLSGYLRKHVVIQEVPEPPPASERPARLAALLSEALSRRLAQSPDPGQDGLERLDYFPSTPPNTVA
ncbi:MAG: hypothetical protein ACE5Q6_07340 [Dehalococcoidia bacterium]